MMRLRPDRTPTSRPLVPGDRHDLVLALAAALLTSLLALPMIPEYLPIPTVPHAVDVLLPCVGLFAILAVLYIALFAGMSALFGPSIQRGDTPSGPKAETKEPADGAMSIPRRTQAEMPVPQRMPARMTDQRRAEIAIEVLLEHRGHPHAGGILLATSKGKVRVDLLAMVGTTIVVLAVRHLKGVVTSAGLGEPWENERRQGDFRDFPNPIDVCMGVSKAITGVVGEEIAIETLVVFTGPAKVHARHHGVTTLGGLRLLLDRIQGTDGGVDASTARSCFDLMTRL